MNFTDSCQTEAETMEIYQGEEKIEKENVLIYLHTICRLNHTSLTDKDW